MINSQTTGSVTAPFRGRVGLQLYGIGILACISLATVNASLNVPSPLLPHVPQRLLVQIKGESDPQDVADLRSDLEADVLLNYPDLEGLQLWKLGPDIDVQTGLTRALNSGLLQFAEPDYLAFATLSPNDPSFADGTQWHLRNRARTGGVTGADIHAEDGWAIRTDASSVIVAIIDTGARTTHEDLRANLWRNPGELAGNGRDDDNNGFIDDIHGINSIRDTGTPTDDSGHGTHVSGLIGAVGNNGKGGSGVAWQVQLMPLRFLNRFGEGATSDAIQCVNYAINNGAQIINNSWGSNAFSAALNSAMSRAQQADVLIVAAAGNERRNNDVTPLYPANYPQPNILSVAATTHRDQLASYSNYGATSVDLAAPGNAILSTWGNSDRSYEFSSGSSMSTPLVAGAAALMRAHFPNAGATEIAKRMMATTDPLPSLRGRCVSGGRLNLGLALGPDLIAGFAMSPTGGAPPLQVTFSDRSLGDVANWHWDFGDGTNVSGLSNPTHTYNRAGTFPVTLQIDSTDGFSVSRTQGISIVANYRVELDFFNWVAPETTTRLELENDGISDPIPLPFLFPFYARARDEIYISSNGVLGFDPDGLATSPNQDIPETASPNALICPYWDDLDPTTGGSLTYGFTGSAPNRKLVVTWENVSLAGTSLPLSFQCILEESTQRIVFQYQEIHPSSSAAGGEGATIGLENDGGFLAAKYLFDGNRPLRNQQTIAFTPLASNGLVVGPERDLRLIQDTNGALAASVPEFQLLNTGSSILGWRAQSDQDWALLSKTQGVLGAGQAEAVVVRINPTASILPPGSYFATIQFDNLSTGTGSVRRKVQLIINGDDSAWSLSPPTSLAARGDQGGPFSPLSRIYTLVNEGNRLVEWSASPNVNWVELEPSSGLLAAGVSESLSLRFTPLITNLRPGVHETQIQIRANSSNLNGLNTLARAVVRGETSAMVLLPDEIQSIDVPSQQVNVPVRIPFELTNHGRRTGSWAIEIDQPWLSAHPQAGELDPDNSISITIEPNEQFQPLPDGRHSAVITLVDQSNPFSSRQKREIHFSKISLTPPRLTIRFENNIPVIRLNGSPNKLYVLEISEDLLTWVQHRRDRTMADGTLTLEATPLNRGQPQFFRAREVKDE